jgi:hypothetical protein
MSLRPHADRRFGRFGFVALALLLAAFARPVAAQAPFAAPLGDDATPGSELTVFHVTMGPGDQVYEKFEHNALWVHDPVRGTDHVYHYGAFDFDEPGYWGRFIRGYWNYSMRVDDLRQTIYVYQFILNRTITTQELNLTPAQRAELRDFLEWNALPENRYYFYDYYRDNCSTRIRDALDRVLGGQLRAATEGSPTGTTFRWHSDRLVADDAAVLTGLRIGLGGGADREIDAWEEMFLPGKVQEQLRRIQVRDEQGNLVPLVREERVLYQAVGREPVRPAPPGWLGWYLLAGLAIGGVFVALARFAPRSRAARFGFAGTTALWAALVGTTGLLLAFLWGFTNHTIAHRNENLLQLNPLMLTLVLVVPVLAFGARWAARPAVWLTFGIAALSLLGLLLKVLPGFDQANLSIIALALPAHLGLAWATLWLSRAASQAPPVAPPPTRAARRRGAPAA